MLGQNARGLSEIIRTSTLTYNSIQLSIVCTIQQILTLTSYIIMASVEVKFLRRTFWYAKIIIIEHYLLDIIFKMEVTLSLTAGITFTDCTFL